LALFDQKEKVMFTDEEMDSVMEQAGLTDDSVIGLWQIQDIVAGAQDAGVLDARIQVWKIQDESEFLITWDGDVTGRLRLASLCVSAKYLLSMPTEDVRVAVDCVLTRVAETVEDLRRDLKLVTGFTA
jgi:hypothetical protein